MSLLFDPDVSLPVLFETRRGLKNLEAENPLSPGIIWHLRLSEDKAKHRVGAFNGAQQAKEILHCIPNVIKNPTAIFGGLRDDGLKGGYCYCGIPPTYFNRSGEGGTPKGGEVFAVYTNDERVIFEWRWEDADLNDPDRPRDFISRFAKVLK